MFVSASVDVGALYRLARPPWIIDLILEVDMDDSIFDHDRITRDGETVGVLGIETGSNVEGPAMCLANDDAAVEVTLRQWESRMGTRVLHCVNVVTDAIEANVEVVDLDAKPTFPRNFSERRHWDERHRTFLSSS
jgi:hypothetical protein